LQKNQAFGRRWGGKSGMASILLIDKKRNGLNLKKEPVFERNA
jgi:hypothetical protein